MQMGEYAKQHPPGAFVLRSSLQMIQLKSVFKFRKKNISDFWNCGKF